MKLKVGVVGVGEISVESHLPVFKRLRKVDLVAVCDRQLTVAKDVAAKFGIHRVYGDLGDMLLKEKLDVVDICTPPRTHASLAIQAMEAGCNVICEKPMATSVKEADQIVDSSRKNGVKFCAARQNLCNPVVIKAKELVATGALGKVLHVEARTYERRDSQLCQDRNHWCHKLPGGIFYEIIPHPVYLVQSFLKELELVEVMGRKVSNREWMKNDELRVLLEGKKWSWEHSCFMQLVHSWRHNRHSWFRDYFESRLVGKNRYHFQTTFPFSNFCRHEQPQSKLAASESAWQHSLNLFQSNQRQGECPLHGHFQVLPKPKRKHCATYECRTRQGDRQSSRISLQETQIAEGLRDN
jgi:predicted dehydrogenase